MAWRKLLLVSCFSAAVLLALLQEGTGASVGTSQVARQEAQEGVEQKIFMQESDASNFLKKRGKRSPKSREEVNAENRQKLWADELRREYHEEQRNEYENFVEEQNDVLLDVYLGAELLAYMVVVELCEELQRCFLNTGGCDNGLDRRHGNRPAALNRRQEPMSAVDHRCSSGIHLIKFKQEERSREAIEQWRQWHYDGLYPSYLYNRHHI